MKNYNDLNDYEIMYMVSENDDVARDILFEKYKPIIYKMANKFKKIGKRLGLEVEDFIQEGYVGLYSAITNYSDNKNAMFYTYAILSIRSKMQNIIVRNSTNKNMTLNNSISLYDSITNDSDSILLDVVSDSNAINPSFEVENKEIEDKFRNRIFELPIIEAAILELKWNGFNNKSIASLLTMDSRKVSNILTKLRKKIIDIR